MRRKLSEIGTCLRIIGRQLQCMLKIGACCFRFSVASFEHTEIIPAVRVLGMKTESLVLFLDRGLEVAGLGQDLR